MLKYDYNILLIFFSTVLHLILNIKLKKLISKVKLVKQLNLKKLLNHIEKNINVSYYIT